MPSSDLILNVRQVAGYSGVANALPSDVIMMQRGGLGGPYVSISPEDFVGTALSQGGSMAISGPLLATSIQAGSGQFSNLASGVFSAQNASLTQFDAAFGSISGAPIATQAYVDAGIAATVLSFNGRSGNVLLGIQDIIGAGGAPIYSPRFLGTPMADTPCPGSCNSRLATTAFVHGSMASYIDGLLATHPFVYTFNGRSGDVVLTNDDVNNAIVATGLWAPIDSPDFTGVPQAPTAAPGANTSQIATTAFVMAAVAGSVSGVSTWNGRTGNVVMDTADITAAGGAPLSSPAFLGTPTAPLAATNANTSQIATCAWVMNQLGLIGGTVTSFNGRTGAVVQVLADITGAGGAPIASPTFTGSPAAPSPMNGDNSTNIATTAWVTTNAVSTFNGRKGAVTLVANDLTAAGGALLASPGFTGVPTAPTASPGTNSLQLATTAFVTAAISAVGAAVTSFNSRTGAVILSSADLSAAGGALLASPTFTGVPAAPTAAPGTNTTQLATCQFVTAAIAGSVTGVASFNTRTGVVTLSSADITGAGGALLAGPALTGVPTAPTAVVGTNTTQIATTAYVLAAIRSPATVAPLIDGTAAVGTSLLYARQDHVHPTDTSRLATAGGTVSGNLNVSGSTGVQALSCTTLTASTSATVSGNIAIGGTGNLSIQGEWITVGAGAFNFQTTSTSGPNATLNCGPITANGTVTISANALYVGYNGIRYTTYGNQLFALYWNNPTIVGTVDNSTGGTMNPPCDETLKEEIAPSTEDFVATVDRLGVYQFRWKPREGDPGPRILRPKVRAGLIAQRLKEVSDDLAFEAGAPGVKTMMFADVNNLIALLTGAVKQLSARVKALEGGTA